MRAVFFLRKTAVLNHILIPSASISFEKEELMYFQLWECFGYFDVPKKTQQKVDKVFAKISSMYGNRTGPQYMIQDGSCVFFLPSQPYFDIPMLLMDQLEPLVSDGCITAISSCGFRLVYRYQPKAKEFVCMMQSFSDCGREF